MGGSICYYDVCFSFLFCVRLCFFIHVITVLFLFYTFLLFESCLCKDFALFTVIWIKSQWFGCDLGFGVVTLNCSLRTVSRNRFSVNIWKQISIFIYYFFYFFFRNWYGGKRSAKLSKLLILKQNFHWFTFSMFTYLTYVLCQLLNVSMNLYFFSFDRRYIRISHLPEINTEEIIKKVCIERAGILYYAQNSIT